MENNTTPRRKYEDEVMELYDYDNTLPFEIPVGDFRIKINHDLDYGFINDNLNY